MRELNVNEVQEVNGGIVVTATVVTVGAVVAGITAVAAMVVAAYQVGQIVGEAAQRSSESNK
jgi:hypothetical protein